MVYVNLIKFRSHEKARRKIALEKPKVEIKEDESKKKKKKVELWQRVFLSGVILLLIVLTLLAKRR